MSNRPTWEDYFFDLAHLVSTRASCPSRKVGCVIIDDQNFVLATGYNGAPSGTFHCDEKCVARQSGKDYHLCKAVHAEMNAVAYAARRGVSLDNSVAYVTTSPCVLCARVMIQAGIVKIFVDAWYDIDVLNLFKEAGVEIVSRKV